jgi:asparagine synthase (glutamine-hydrolysing)
MCGICGIAGELTRDADATRRLDRMLKKLAHRGPDDRGGFEDPAAGILLGHHRLSILDLSAAGRQPMKSGAGRFELVLNGEIYNFLELRRELGSPRSGGSWRSGSDTEVLLELWEREGPECLDRCRGMFAFALWDNHEKELWLVRDRFGVKPLYYAFKDGPDGRSLSFASEIPALFSAGAAREPDLETWATYLAHGLYDHGKATFWHGIRRLPPGSWLRFSPATGVFRHHRWYDPAQAAEDSPDLRSDAEVQAELAALLEESIALRLRADVEIGVCLSGGLDSSLLLGLLRKRLGKDLQLRSYTFYSGDAYYDELPWVDTMLRGTRVRPRYCQLSSAEVPELAARVLEQQAEPYGGLPTVAMAKVFAAAREDGVKVLLDGNGMDEAWAGYDYYRRGIELNSALLGGRGPVQGSRSPAVLPDVLVPEFAARAKTLEVRLPFSDALANAQLRDLESAKIPRSLRFSDRVSMASGCELREPFLDHRLVELGLRQPADRKIRAPREGRGEEGKWLVRQVARKLLPSGISEAPKRPVQTPQREWLRGPLAGWAETTIEAALEARPDIFDRNAVRRAFRAFLAGQGDNSFPVWQWISAGMLLAR